MAVESYLDKLPDGQQNAMSPREQAILLALLVVLTVADTVLCTVNLYYYTDTYAQYFNQGTGAVYILVSIPIVLREVHKFAIIVDF